MSSTSAFAYIVITLSIIYAFTIPAIGDLSDLLDEKDLYNQAIEATIQIEDRKNALLADFNRISAADIEKVETLIPSSLNFVKLVADIDVAASRHGISIDKVSYVDNSLNATSLTEAQTIDRYQSATVNFELEATYERFNAFLNELEKSLRILDVKSVMIATGPGQVLTYRVSFETYWSQ